MELRKYIRTIIAPTPASKRARAMKKAKAERAKAKREAAKERLKKNRAAKAERAKQKLPKDARAPAQGASGKIPFPRPIDGLEKNLGYKFTDKSILREALIHPGTVGTLKEKISSNQRLEFLGDSVLQSIITESVFKKFPDFHEGKLTKIRVALTQGIFLAELSRGMDIPGFLAIPKCSEELRDSSSVAEDAFEAVVGAIFLDSNFETARKIVLSWYKRKIDELPGLMSSQNPKGALQEAAAKHGEKVEYALVSQSGPDHKKVFEVEVRIGGKAFAKASANSKKSAEIKAAREAVKIYAESLKPNLSETEISGK